MTLATFAAFAAAAISLINVVVTSRLTRRGQKEQWRREAERPTVATALATSNECCDKWIEAADLKEEWGDALVTGGPDDEPDGRAAEIWKAYVEGLALYNKLRFQLAELDLIAGPGVRRVAAAIETAHLSIRNVIRPDGGTQDPSSRTRKEIIKIEDLHHELITAARIDIGVDGRATVGLRSGIWRAFRKARRARRALRRARVRRLGR